MPASVGAPPEFPPLEGPSASIPAAPVPVASIPADDVPLTPLVPPEPARIPDAPAVVLPAVPVVVAPPLPAAADRPPAVEVVLPEVPLAGVIFTGCIGSDGDSPTHAVSSQISAEVRAVTMGH